MKKRLLTSIVATLLTSNVLANTENMTAHSAFKAELASMQENYYRSLRLDDWIAMGMTEKDISTTMARLKANKEGLLIDLNNPNTRGHWTYEFTKTAQNLEDQANTLNTPTAYGRASTVYLVASYPNLHQPNEIAALDKAVDLYLKAAKLNGESVEKVDLKRFDNRSIPGLLHLPTNTKTNLPAIIWTGGVDKTLIEHKTDFKSLLESGYAVLTIDMPGAGLDYRNHLKLGEETASHDAAFAFLQNHPQIDRNRIGVLGSSGSGVALIPFAVQQTDLRAVVARCALVDGPIGKQATLKFIPDMSAHSFIARIGGDAGDMRYFKNMATKFSIANKGMFNGQLRIDTPILVINTKKDPVAPIEDMKRTAELSTEGEMFISDEVGHCPDSLEAQNKIIAFIKSNV
ncbi:alpha/beta hydrolase [Vibrio algarum]|uniref:Alpha/beta hydrolase n=1 Tax=Vibrio algarum TaxID=3020714 RepID=A0ABT4YYU9_9VIBR|nr:alpha/beta hydrolase [Vibrio sp. KJ40-1]MDB1126209.1 alpha/beta hydrolase [Vibrio sp. KJ40-1]